MRRHTDTILLRPYDLQVLAKRLAGITSPQRITLQPQSAQAMARALWFYADVLALPSEDRETYTIDVWTPAGGICETLARTNHGTVARAAFDEACKHRPSHLVTLRQGMRVVARSKPEDAP